MNWHRSTTAGLLAICLTANLPAQDYILRPGTRGFDPDMNRYGATRAKPRPEAGDFNQGDPSRTRLNIEILMPARGGSLAAQRWSEKLAQMGHSARTRPAILDDDPAIEESKRGPLRTVTLIGRLGSRGQLHFPNHTYSLGESASLEEWLTELKTYGAQGSPEGQPLWGLDRAQFNKLYAELSTVIKSKTAGRSLKEAIRSLELPNDYPVSFSVAAEEALSANGPARRHTNVKGLSMGTGLAYLLSEQDLGFRPARTPSGDIALRIEPLSGGASQVRDAEKTPDVWPVGWELREPAASADSENAKPQLPLRLRVAPGYFKVARRGFADVPLREVFSRSREETGIPVLVARPALSRAGLDLEAARVDLRPRHQSWHMALKRATASLGLTGELRRDEVGNPLFWVRPAAHRR